MDKMKSYRVGKKKDKEKGRKKDKKKRKIRVADAKREKKGIRRGFC